jgi:hypothetical protein
VAPSVTPLVDAGLLIDQKWLVRVVAAGFGTAPRIDDGSNGSDLHQSTLGAQVQYRRKLLGRMAVAGGIGAGVLHVSADGHATVPYEGVAVSHTAFCGAAGLALHVALWTKIELSIESQALVAVPAADIWAASGGPAKTGQPTVLVALGLAVIP